MSGARLILMMLVGGFLAEAAVAGIFSRKSKTSPQRVPELIGILKSDAKERNRANAADELGSHDPQANPDIVPALLDALRDSSDDVRLQAVQALGKLRPVRPEVGQALEHAQSGDSSTKVRLQARTTLWQYQLAGYRANKSEGPSVSPPAPLPKTPPLTTTPEPPLLEPALTPSASAPARRMPQAAPASRLAPIPAAQTKAAPVPPVYARPLPSGAPKPPLVPTVPPVLRTPPSDEGPELNPPM
jgi:hypothetical protein